MNLSQKKRTGMFAAILVSCIACSMLSTALNTALPQIMDEFQVNVSTGHWLTSIYSLIMGIMTLATPFLLKRFKSKTLYLVTLVIFMTGLVMDGFTSSFLVMMVGRILQAAGNGIMVAQGQVMILTAYPQENRGSIMGIYGLAVGAAPIFAPTVAGIIVDLFGWRMIFYAVFCIAFFSLIIAAVTFENVLENAVEKFDILSFALCGGGFNGLLLAAGNIGSYSVISMPVLLPLFVGLVSSCFFVFRQLYMEKPFIELGILKKERYRTAIIASVIMYMAVMASSILLPVYIQSVRGYSATISGLVTMPGAIASALISPVSGKLYDKYGINKIFSGGGSLLAISNLGMILIPGNAPLFVPAALNVVRCAGIGCMMMPLVTWGMSCLEKELTSDGTALLTSLRTVAGAFGSAMFMAVFSIVSANTTGLSGIRAAFVGLMVIGVIEMILAFYVSKRNV